MTGLRVQQLPGNEGSQFDASLGNKYARNPMTTRASSY
jgi:hypothetical protein